jgi:hypothetical protein
MVNEKETKYSLIDNSMENMEFSAKSFLNAFNDIDNRPVEKVQVIPNIDYSQMESTYQELLSFLDI